MPMLALIGIGLMYGPMRPETNAIGSSAAMTVKVARMVGPPTSLTASGIMSDIEPLSIDRCRWTFSTITMASSTRMPIAKISANSDTRLIVKPQAQEANSVAARVTMTAAPTTTASRLPTASNTRSTTDAVANKSFSISFFALSLAVTP